MCEENEPIMVCVKFKPTKQTETSEGCSDDGPHRNIKSRHNAIVSTVRNAIVDSIQEIFGDWHSLVEIGRLAVSFDPNVGEYIVSCLIIPQAIPNRIVKAASYEAGYRLSRNPYLRTTICKRVNAYVRGKKVIKGYMAKVGVHSFDDLVESCNEGSAAESNHLG